MFYEDGGDRPRGKKRKSTDVPVRSSPLLHLGSVWTLGVKLLVACTDTAPEEEADTLEVLSPHAELGVPKGPVAREAILSLLLARSARRAAGRDGLRDEERAMLARHTRALLSEDPINAVALRASRVLGDAAFAFSAHCLALEHAPADPVTWAALADLVEKHGGGAAAAKVAEMGAAEQKWRAMLFYSKSAAPLSHLTAAQRRELAASKAKCAAFFSAGAEPHARPQRAQGASSAATAQAARDEFLSAAAGKQRRFSEASEQSSLPRARGRGQVAARSETPMETEEMKTRPGSLFLGAPSPAPEPGPVVRGFFAPLPPRTVRADDSQSDASDWSGIHLAEDGQGKSPGPSSASDENSGMVRVGSIAVDTIPDSMADAGGALPRKVKKTSLRVSDDDEENDDEDKGDHHDHGDGDDEKQKHAGLERRRRPRKM